MVIQYEDLEYDQGVVEHSLVMISTNLIILRSAHYSDIDKQLAIANLKRYQRQIELICSAAEKEMNQFLETQSRLEQHK